LLVDGVAGGDAIDERLDEVLLVAEPRAAVDRASDLGQDLLVVAVAARLPVALDEQQDVVDGDLDLLDELDLEHHVVVDRLLLGLVRLAELGVQVEVVAEVVLHLSGRQEVVAREVVEGGRGCSAGAGSRRTAR
jgi:hypothetical protein